MASNRAPRTLVLAAFATIYLVWGSTFLAIRVAVRYWPPFFMASLRFLVAGTVLYLLARRSGAPAPGRDGWRRALWIGGGLILFGNGGIVWAEQVASASVAALVLASTPLWVALMSWAGGGRRPAGAELGAIALGIGGIAMLAAPGGDAAATPPLAMAALVLAAVGQAVAAVRAQSAPRLSPLMTAATASLCGAVMLSVVSLALGEPARLTRAVLSPAAIGVFVYLVGLGSLVALSAYAWLLQVSTPARVATYSFVNPVVAAALGWLVLGEPLGPRELLAGLAVVAAVAITVGAGSRASTPPLELAARRA
jgi:drug/metabolite transporter (DMT)-like permease